MAAEVLGFLQQLARSGGQSDGVAEIGVVLAKFLKARCHGRHASKKRKPGFVWFCFVLFCFVGVQLSVLPQWVSATR